MPRTKITPLLTRARATIRYGTDGQWYWFFDTDGPGQPTWWEPSEATPNFTLLVLESLKQQLKLSWPDAVEAVRLLTRHPEDPKVVAPETQDEQPAGTPVTSSPAAQDAGATG